MRGPSKRLPFVKMNGLGNDFVIVVAEPAAFAPTATQVRAIADRVGGVGCDQLIAIGGSNQADVALRMWNADGGKIGACGNAARCLGWLVMEAMGRDEARIETAAGVVAASRSGGDVVTVDMGAPALAWDQIPLAWEMGTRQIELNIDATLRDPGCVSMGNPHVVFFVPDATAAPVARAGPGIERHWLFPERANVGFAQIEGRDRIRLRVWERGAGETRACGTGACAALVAASRRGLCGRAATVIMDGGDLLVSWRETDDHVLLTGAVAVEFTGWLPALEIAA